MASARRSRASFRKGERQNGGVDVAEAWVGAPDPRLRSRIQLGCGQCGDLLELLSAGEALAGTYRSPEQAPPPLLPMQPAGADRQKTCWTRGPSVRQAAIGRLM